MLRTVTALVIIFSLTYNTYADDFTITADSLAERASAKLGIVTDGNEPPIVDLSTEQPTNLDEPIAREIAYALESILSPTTGFFPSFPGNQDEYPLAYLDDLCIGAQVFSYSGRQTKAETILDRLAGYVDINIAEATENADTNGIYGALKLYKDPFSSKYFAVPANACAFVSGKVVHEASLAA